jgi:hypothetical protein
MHTTSATGSYSRLNCRCDPGYSCAYYKQIQAIDTLNATLSDFNNNVVRAINVQTRATTTFLGRGTTATADGVLQNASFKNPAYVSTDPAGNLYIAENNGGRIRKSSPTGVVSTGERVVAATPAGRASIRLRRLRRPDSVSAL